VKQLFPTKDDSKFDKYFDNLYSGKLIKDTIGRKGFPGLYIFGSPYSRGEGGIGVSSAKIVV